MAARLRLQWRHEQLYFNPATVKMLSNLKDRVIDAIRAAVGRLSYSTNFHTYLGQHALIIHEELPTPNEENVDEERYHFMSLLLNLVNAFLYPIYQLIRLFTLMILFPFFVMYFLMWKFLPIVDHEGLIPIPNARLLQSEITVNRQKQACLEHLMHMATLEGVGRLLYDKVSFRLFFWLWFLLTTSFGPRANYASLGRSDQVRTHCKALNVGFHDVRKITKLCLFRSEYKTHNKRVASLAEVRSGIVGYPNVGRSSLMVKVESICFD
ncbi:Glucose-methanol-choline oxidoreductase, C-terminal [Artemisia annua]|uniref:Glucose-methanol-choline oxidoreductase, C-terminal n=1 Tax=Artemisia annua TaxID=35608 RepID=A0A2U1KP15_ARTAN|nr:Glucose-methanol-choline oxidoreductase, C-terminal [Artemisia annua]